MSTALAIAPATLVRETLSGDWSFTDPAHTLLLVIASGRARLRQGQGDESLVGAGSVLLVPPGAGLTLRGVEELKVTRLSFDPERLLPAQSAVEALGSVDAALVALERGQPALLGLSPRHAGAVADALARIEAELREPRLGHDLLVRAQLLELLVALARAEHMLDGDPERHRAWSLRSA